MLKVLFVVEGFTDIRFVTGLSEICDLTMVTPSTHFRESGLAGRIQQSGVVVTVDELPGNRLQYQAQCFRYLWTKAQEFDVILAQEFLRGAFNACIVGALRKTPVVTYVCIAPVEYYRCRRKRGQVGAIKAVAGESLIRTLMMINGKLAARCVALGPYLMDLASRYCSRTTNGYYYGVDTEYYRPISDAEQLRLRAKLNLPADKFLIFLASRISHEKDPETVLRATSLARAQGLDAALINVGGGYQDFLDLATRLSLPDVEQWVLGRPAAHPMKELAEYYQAADALAQASLEEGAGMAPLEALACGTPAVCTAVGGLARILPGYARLTPRGDAEAMAREFLWIARNCEEARAQALRGREHVRGVWSRNRAFAELGQVLAEVSLTGSDPLATTAS
jgi:glycosyltransferase involved in cell wall biosynthesis